MDVKKVFRQISKKLLADFIQSGEILHQGSKGTLRESALKEFLSKGGRLPEKFGIGSGEIASANSETSQQSDLIIYDRLDGVPLLYDPATQVFPIEYVFGTIEVKSQLSKTKLTEALDGIRSVKRLATGPVPFGIVFAYSLASNSLSSLAQNVRDWERDVPPECRVNLVCVLGEGIIFHQDSSSRMQLFENDVTAQQNIGWLEFKEDSQPSHSG